MIRKIFWLIIALLLLLLGYFFVFHYGKIIDYYDSNVGEKDTREVVATITSFSGDVQLKAAKKLVYKTAKEDEKLHYYDTIITGDKSTAMVHFSSGLDLKLDPNSILVLEKPEGGKDGQVVISFLRGQYTVVNTGSSGQVLLQKEKDVFDLAGRISNQLAMAPKLPPVEEPTPRPTPIATATPKPTPEKIAREKHATPTPVPIKESLPDDYIASVVKKQRPFFNRCYAQHLRLNPNASGRINLSFIIQPTGSVSDVKILRSTISDPKLQKCTMTVIERTVFRPYDGDPIVVNYPINFE